MSLKATSIVIATWNRSGSVFHAGLELVLPDRLDRLDPIHPERANDANILRVALGIDDQRDDGYALITGASRFVGEFCLD